MHRIRGSRIPGRVGVVAPIKATVRCGVARRVERLSLLQRSGTVP
jgi:hypothetical protein